MAGYRIICQFICIADEQDLTWRFDFSPVAGHESGLRGLQSVIAL